MKKKSINYSNLTKRELEYLKELYVQEKVNSMNLEELKKFVKENINHHITETIGDEEEKEAWKEIEIFFGDSLETIVNKVKKKFEAYPESMQIEESEYEKRLELLKNNKLDNDKADMWED